MTVTQDSGYKQVKTAPLEKHRYESFDLMQKLFVATFPVKIKSLLHGAICWEHLYKSQFMLAIFLRFFLFKFEKSFLSATFFIKVFLLEFILCFRKTSQTLSDFTKGLSIWATTIPFFEQVVQCLCLFEFHLRNILLDFHLQNMTSLYFHRAFHYAYLQLRCLLHMKINWRFHLPHKKLDLNV